jgi:hypothetical protein
MSRFQLTNSFESRFDDRLISFMTRVFDIMPWTRSYAPTEISAVLSGRKAQALTRVAVEPIEPIVEVVEPILDQREAAVIRLVGFLAEMTALIAMFIVILAAVVGMRYGTSLIAPLMGDSIALLTLRLTTDFLLTFDVLVFLFGVYRALDRSLRS